MSKSKKQVILVAGLGFGDEGKGSIIDFLTEKYKPHTIVRYNGGSQALHHVVRPDGLFHGFSQFGSGTFHPGVNTYLSRFMLVDPFFLSGESHDLDYKSGDFSSAKRVVIDKNCVVITPFHRIINQMLEISRKDNRHGSCGRGVGQAMEDLNLMRTNTLLVGDLIDRRLTRSKLKHLQVLKIDLAEQLVDEDWDNLSLWAKLKELKEDLRVERLVQDYYDLFGFGYFKIGNDERLRRIFGRSGVIIFEGAQGVLLDPQFGLIPHVTKTKTTFENADELLKDANYDGGISKIGVIRAYSTRHGAGPLLTEDSRLTRLLPEIHNKDNEWQGRFRIGYFDSVATRYSLSKIGRVDSIAMTNIDRLISIRPLKVCTGYATNNSKPIYQSLKEIKSDKDYTRYIEFIKSLGIPISILSFGPTAEDKKIL